MTFTKPLWRTCTKLNVKLDKATLVADIFSEMIHFNFIFSLSKMKLQLARTVFLTQPETYSCRLSMSALHLSLWCWYLVWFGSAFLWANAWDIGRKVNYASCKMSFTCSMKITGIMKTVPACRDLEIRNVLFSLKSRCSPCHPVIHNTHDVEIWMFH